MSRTEQRIEGDRTPEDEREREHEEVREEVAPLRTDYAPEGTDARTGPGRP